MSGCLLQNIFPNTSCVVIPGGDATIIFAVIATLVTVGLLLIISRRKAK